MGAPTLACCVVLAGLWFVVGCNPQKPDADTSYVSGSEDVCLTPRQRIALKGEAETSSEAAWKLSEYYTMCENSTVKYMAVMEDLARRGDPKAMYNIAVALKDDESEEKRRRALSLIQQAAILNYEPAVRELRSSTILAGIARSFKPELRPNLPIDVPGKFVRPTAEEFQKLCGSKEEEDRQYCEWAVGALADNRCTGVAVNVFQPATRKSIIAAMIFKDETARELILRRLQCKKKPAPK